jgi:hypothetical protein
MSFTKVPNAVANAFARSHPGFTSLDMDPAPMASF